MLEDRWICDRIPTERFPDYTRGNAGEVLADPVSPLAWTFCWEPGPVQGCVDGFEQMGVFDRLEYGDPPASFGLFGGYFYNSLTQSRLFGVRSGAGWEAVDRTFFDTASQDIPPYVEDDWHQSPCKTEKVTSVMGWVVTHRQRSRGRAAEARGQGAARQPARPDDADRRATASPGRSASSATCGSSSARWSGRRWGARSRPGILPGAARRGRARGDRQADDRHRRRRLGRHRRPDLRHVAAGARLGRARRRSSTATSTACSTGSAKSGSADAQRFLAAIDTFMYDHGGRGPNEWDIYQWSYETDRRCCCRRSRSHVGAHDDANPATHDRRRSRRAQAPDRQVRGGVRRQPRGARHVPDRGQLARRLDGRPRADQVEQHPLPPRGADVLRRARRADDRARPPRPPSPDLHAARRRARRLRRRPGVVHGHARRARGRLPRRSTSSSRRTSSTAPRRPSASGSGAGDATASNRCRSATC